METLLFELYVTITMMVNLVLMMTVVLIPVIAIIKIGTFIFAYARDVIKHSNRRGNHQM